MLFLLFHIGRDRYALEAGRVVEVLPLVRLQKIPRAPRGVAGLFNYRGQLVPAVDLCELATGIPAREQLSTRIILVRHADAAGREHLLGLIAERAAEIIRLDGRQPAHSGPSVGQVPWLGPVLMDGAGVIQCLREQQLLSDEVRALLFTPHAAAR